MAELLFFIAGTLSGYALFKFLLPGTIHRALQEHEGKKIIIVLDDGAYKVEVEKIDLDKVEE